ncbi:MAG: PA14 domain-containing protein, partial [bacterium]
AKCDNNNEVYKTAAQVYLEKDKYYDLKVEQYDQGGGAVLKMFWKRPSSESGTILSPSALFTLYNPSPPVGTGSGLMGSYYTGKDFGQIVANQKDRKINFDWLNEGPSKTGNDEFSVRWTGEISSRFSEVYTFTLAANDGVRMWIDNEKVIDEWHQVDSNNLAVYTAKVNLTAGERYPIKVEYFENTGNAGVYLKWRSPSENEKYIPASALYPGDPVPIDSVTVTPSVTVSSVTEVTKTFEPGYTAIYIPDSEKPQFTQALIAQGLGIFKFGPLVYDNSTPPRKTWLTSFDKFSHKIGYYVFNPGTANETINLSLDETAENPLDAMVYTGWNFLSNPSDSPKTLSELNYEKRICTDLSGEVNCDGYSVSVNLANLSYGWKGQNKAAYRKVYVLNDPRATSQTANPFTVIDVVNTGIENVQIPAGKMFWFYFFN